jgi:hypothetical protein
VFENVHVVGEGRGDVRTYSEKFNRPSEEIFESLAINQTSKVRGVRRGKNEHVAKLTGRSSACP